MDQPACWVDPERGTVTHFSIGSLFWLRRRLHDFTAFTIRELDRPPEVVG